MADEIKSRTSIYPEWLTGWWWLSAPLGILIAARFAWEKTVWTWRQGPQVVGFQLSHNAPLLAIGGVLSCYLMGIWLLPGGYHLAKEWKTATRRDKIMALLAVLVTIAFFLPDEALAFAR